MLGKELSGNFKKLCVALVCEELAFDVKTFNELIEVNFGISELSYYICLPVGTEIEWTLGYLSTKRSNRSPGTDRRQRAKGYEKEVQSR